MDLINKNMKELDFLNTIEGWLPHSQNIMTCLNSHLFIVNDYSYHHKVETYNSKFEGNDDYIDTTQKGNVKD